MSALLEREAELLDLFDAANDVTPLVGLADDEIIIDCFAGGGGASLGIEWATGRSPDEAINHSATAIAIHEANHPTTRHHHADVWEVDPLEVARGREVGLLWASPDCTHFSRAKGGKPVSKRIRMLAHVVIRYAKAVRPRIIALENVPEFLTWGPVSRETGKPDPKRKGKSFRTWVRQLRRLGYAVEWRLLRGCDFGAPTTRKRLFVVARCDGEPIRWPRPTHGRGCAQPWRTAAECIDWSLPCPSIFLTREEAKTLGVNVRRPLAAATLRRIARGIDRFVLHAAEPFIIGIDHRGSGESSAWPSAAPLTTVTTEARHALVVPSLIQCGYGEREGQAPRVLDLTQPLGTIVGGGNKHALVAAFLAKHFGDRGQRPGSALSEPLATITASDHNALVASHLVKYKGTCRDGHALSEPMPTVQAQANHLAEVRAFLVAYYGNERDGQSLRDPMRTVTPRDRLGLVTIQGTDYAIVDVGMRMLTPRERARAQGFPDDYVLEVEVEVVQRTKRGERRVRRATTLDEQGEMIGNSVNPHVASALLRANLGAPVAHARAA